MTYQLIALTVGKKSLEQKLPSKGGTCRAGCLERKNIMNEKYTTKEAEEKLISDLVGTNPI